MNNESLVVNMQDTDGKPSCSEKVDFSEKLAKVHKGMPPLDMSGRATSPFEFWPAKVFYFPIALQWLGLSIKYRSLTLPTAANPMFPLGGLVGESKASVMSDLEGKAKERFADFHCFTRSNGAFGEEEVDRALEVVSEGGLTLPFVAKPDMGCRGTGVQLIKSRDNLASYLEVFPSGRQIIFQQYVPYEAEAGIFYVRRPEEEKGRILSLTLKYFPHIFGNGTSTIEELIFADKRAGPLAHIYLPRHKSRLKEVLGVGEPMRLAFTGSHSRGTIFRNGNQYITDEMRDAFDEVADGIPGFCFGRFDARFPSLEDLQKGGEFHLMEVNGAGGEMTHIWDAKTTLFEAYRDLMEQFRILFQIGADNRTLGHKPSTLRQIYKAWKDERTMTELYPPTE
jgi:hypothetical protein